jgi:hypothetical protein
LVAPTGFDGFCILQVPIPLPGVLKTRDRGVNGNRHCSTRRFSISGQTPRRTRASYWQGSTVAPGKAEIWQLYVVAGHSITNFKGLREWAASVRHH